MHCVQKNLAWLTIVILWMGLTPPATAEVQLHVGQPAPKFELKDTQGKLHRLTDYAGKVVVIHFQSCNCPWDKAYQPILNDIAGQFASDPSAGVNAGPQIVFLAINSNRTEFIEQITAYHAGGAVAYPVLKDNANRVADDYGAMTTPHIFVVNADETQSLAYIGGIEKAPISPQECGNSQEQYLVPVLTALKKGQNPPVTETQAIGCSIKRE